MTTNYLMKPRDPYKDRIVTVVVVGEWSKFVLNQCDFLLLDVRVEHNIIAKETSKMLVIISQSLS